ncbi:MULTISPECIES: FtsX-like permease family protein [unclassified Clostridioides]|uniref:FtsX-like permease family protein n=1 Tax=unclassified Clostridioides TaxID=2635829 RepID=UPI001D1176DA|nr:ABC transporter permease [Clostridioides sp. ZZV14-6150]MCC0661620.1 ABC transporter permease [Clostridioides sp. ZZV14-6154]MCC0668993.1 ABC transporter permease [Clostridioides sp. ZZV14-6153]MCC0718191.1 ABC transporter permease [Clostridioides sp. ZZV14-6105]MCC0721532.1 ABC transporter permease [Clostridioides sp. ZZV14-6104]MCC0743863.1 ABC transporter permease [Clostridioides sp. ZZV14-6044]MCC0752585.1 ABC transporter permease [Clostridioides sp. ZZV13-5731]WLD29329.1 ABC transpor
MNIKQFAINNISRNIKAYLGYLASIVISSSLLFSFIMFTSHPGLDIAQFPDYLKEGLKMSKIIAYLFLFFFVFYSVSVFLKSRYKEFGILYITGISKRQVMKLVLIENIVINIVSSVIGIIVGLIFSKIFLVTMSTFLELSPLEFYIPLNAMFSTLIYFMVLAILTSIFTSFIIKENQVLKLLKGTKTPKPEPKTSLILAILSICLFIIAYYSAVTSTDQYTTYLRLVPVTSLTIVATYLFFSQFSVYFIKKLKMKKSFYRSNTNMLWISNLIYKVKDNARIFFLITITSAVAFTAIGTVYSFWKDVKRQINLIYPSTIYYSTMTLHNDTNKPDSKEKDKERMSFIENKLKKEGIDYARVNGEFKTVFPKKSDFNVRIMKESKYLEITKTIGVKPISFEDNESISLFSSSLPGDKKVKENVIIGNRSLKVAKQVEECVMPAYYKNMYVVKDNFYDSIKSKFIIDRFSTFEVEDSSKTIDICRQFEDKFDNESRMQPYLFFSKELMIETGKLTYSTFMFLAVFIGLIFFVTTSSFLYNKFYMDCQIDKKKYEQLNKLGMTYKEIKRASTIEIGIVFLLPYVVAVVHSVFALTALKNSFDIEVASSAVLVMGSLFIVQIVYFLLIRNNYLKEIRLNLVNF